MSKNYKNSTVNTKFVPLKEMQEYPIYDRMSAAVDKIQAEKLAARGQE